MIHAVFIFNTSGQARLTKFYTPLQQSSQTLIEKIFSLVYSRPSGLCNFLDAPDLDAFLSPKVGREEKWRVVYRCYATLYFVFIVDEAESELGILDLIQVFVESLDRVFENVCELDLVFHFDEAHHVLSEIIQGGLVLETNIDEIESSGPPTHRIVSKFSSDHVAQAAQQAAKGRKDSYASSNPLSLGMGRSAGLGSRGSGLQAPLDWLTTKLTGTATR